MYNVARLDNPDNYDLATFDQAKALRKAKQLSKENHVPYGVWFIDGDNVWRSHIVYNGDIYELNA